MLLLTDTCTVTKAAVNCKLLPPDLPGLTLLSVSGCRQLVDEVIARAIRRESVWTESQVCCLWRLGHNVLNCPTSSECMCVCVCVCMRVTICTSPTSCDVYIYLPFTHYEQRSFTFSKCDDLYPLFLMGPCV